MAIITCKMCGGGLATQPYSPVAQCGYCGSVQTVPKTVDGQLLTSFDQANRLRLAGNFGAASELYQQIAAANPMETEAYWGQLLCQYGVDYLPDPFTGRRTPACRWPSAECVTDNPLFKRVFETADPTTLQLYRDEAMQIEALRKSMTAAPVPPAAPVDASALMKRAQLFLEDGKWAEADQYFERVLDLEPENAHAYLGKLMAQCWVSQPQQLAQLPQPFDQNENYKKALRFGDEALTATLNEHLNVIYQRLEEQRKQEEERLRQNELLRRKTLYAQADQLLTNAVTPDQCAQAKNLFLSIADYEDAQEQAALCDKRAFHIRFDSVCAAFEQCRKEEQIPQFKKDFQTFASRIDVSEWLEKCDQKALALRYAKARQLLYGTTLTPDTTYRQAKALFVSLGDYKDSAALAQACDDALQRRAEKAHNARRKRKNLLIGLSISAVILLIFAILFPTLIYPAIRYAWAEKLLADEKYEQAAAVFEALDDYRDSQDRVDEVHYVWADSLAE